MIKHSTAKLINPFKIAISIVLVYLTARYLGASPAEEAWATLTVFVVSDVHFGGTVYAAFYRALGTVIGALIAILLLYILPTTHWSTVLAGLFIIGLVCGKIIEKKPSLRICGATAVLIFVLGIGLPEPWQLSLHRLGYILLSIGIVFLVSLLIFPRYSSQTLAERMAMTLRKNSEILPILLTSYVSGEPLPAQAQQEIKELRQRLDSSRQLLNEMKVEMWRSGSRSKITVLFRHFIDSQATILHSLIVMTRIVERQEGKDIAQHIVDSMQALTQTIQKTLIDLSIYIHNPEITLERYVLTNALQLINQQLTIVRSSRGFAKYPNDVLIGLCAFVFNLEMIARELINIKKYITHAYH